MRRQNIVVNLTIQFNNPVQPPQWGAPVLLTQVALVVDEGGNALYQPAYHSQPAAAENITDELFAALQQQLAAVGLAVSRMPPSVPTPAPVTDAEASA